MQTAYQLAPTYIPLAARVARDFVNCNHRLDEDECLGVAFESLVRAEPKYDSSRAQPSTFFYKAVRNSLISYARWVSRQPVACDGIGLMIRDRKDGDLVENPALAVDDKSLADVEYSADFLRFYNALPEQERALILMRMRNPHILQRECAAIMRKMFGGCITQARISEMLTDIRKKYDEFFK